MTQMKDSGIKWAGQIPQSWEVVPIKTLLKKKKEILETWTDENVLSLTLNGVIVRDLLNPKGKMPATFDGYQTIDKGNFILCLFDIDVTPRCVGVAYNDGVTSPAYSQYITKWGVTQYYYYLLLMMDNDKVLLSYSKTLRSTLTDEYFGAVKVPITSDVKEQQVIADFLDEKVAKIDEIIADTKLSIDKLKDYKQSVITEVVTVGVNGNLKDEDFESKKFKYLYKTGKGLTVTKADLVEEGIPTISYGQIHSYTTTFFDATGLPTLPSSYYDISSAVLERGDIVFADTSEDIEGSGDFSVKDTDEIILAGYHDVVAKPLKTNNNNYKFIGYYLESNVYREQLRSMVQGVKVYSISQGLIKQTKLRLPNLHEQELIANYLDEKTKTIDELITDKESLISKYEDYKKSMIYEYVTGKKRVQ